MRSGFFDQVSPSAEPQIDTSSDSCSIWSVMVSRQRNVRVALEEMSKASPSPLATMGLFAGINASCISRRRFRCDEDCSISGHTGRIPRQLAQVTCLELQGKHGM